MFSNIFQSSEIFDALLQSKLRNKITSIISLISLIIASIIRLLFLKLELSVVFFSIALLIETSIMFFITYSYLKTIKFKFIKPSKESTYKLISNSSPLLLSSIFAFIYLKIDQIMIKYIMDFESVGIYASAVKISEILYFIPILICNSFFPIIIKSKDNPRYHKIIKSRLYVVVLGLSFTITITIFILSEWLIKTLYGSDFLLAINVLRTHVWSIIFIGLNAIFSKYILLANNQKVFVKISLTGAITNILLNIILINSIGIIGAAISTLISYAIVAIMMYINKNKNEKIFK